MTEESDYKNDVVFGEDGLTIVASRYIFQERRLTNLDESRWIMLSLRQLFSSDEFKNFNLTSYHPLYKFGEQVSSSSSFFVLFQLSGMTNFFLTVFGNESWSIDVDCSSNSSYDRGGCSVAS